MAQHIKKRAAVPKSYLNKLDRLGGIHRLRPSTNKRVSQTSRKVNRAYGGYITANDLKDRIIRAFITEEIKEVKKQMAKKAATKAAKVATKGTKGKKKRGKKKRAN